VPPVIVTGTTLVLEGDCSETPWGSHGAEVDIRYQQHSSFELPTSCCSSGNPSQWLADCSNMSLFLSILSGGLKVFQLLSLSIAVKPLLLLPS
jgi:hypothetical protein